MARLCIVSREFSMLYGYLMILLERELSGPEPLEVIADRRRERRPDDDPRPPDGIERRGRMDGGLQTLGYVIVGGETDASGGRVGRRLGGMTPALREAVAAGVRLRMLARRAAIPVLLLFGAAMIGLAIAVATPSSGVDVLARLVAGMTSSWYRDTTTLASHPSASVNTVPAALPAPPASGALAPVAPPPIPAPSLRQVAPEPPKTERVAAPAVPLPVPALSPRQPAPEPPKTERVAAPVAPLPVPAPSPRQPAPEARKTERAMTDSAPAGAERDNSMPSGAERRMTGPRFPGMPRVALSTEPEGSGAERTITYTARLADPAGRPLSDADVSLHGALPDGRSVQARLDPTSTPGAYAGRLMVGRQTPGLLRLRVMLGGSLLDIPVDR